MVRIKYKEAIGLEIKKGEPSKGKKPSKAELQKLYVKESKSIREVAKILGCSKDKVYRALREYGITRRLRARRSQLEKYDLADLSLWAKEKGIRGLARELGINHGTLLHYLKRHPK